MPIRDVHATASLQTREICPGGSVGPTRDRRPLSQPRPPTLEPSALHNDLLPGPIAQRIHLPPVSCHAPVVKSGLRGIDQRPKSKTLLQKSLPPRRWPGLPPF